LPSVARSRAWIAVTIDIGVSPSVAELRSAKMR
jgi:hypothetical protein